ncbi:MAG: MBL fold metallo-hydrolase [Ktedonobacteraceae bacterium]|nr:MBL fold metallo-hydrolase [Ktedonobacteraceae bacterium]
MMKLRNWATAGAVALGAAGAGLALKSVLPQHFAIDQAYEPQEAVPDSSTWPEIEVTFLRCGYVTLPEFLVVRGAFSFVPHVNAYSAVLIRHPQGTFLYDTGFCSNIYAFLRNQSLFFRTLLGGFIFEQALSSHLQQLEVKPDDLDFVLLSHLHWDHVSGIPDLPGVPLRINRVEYDAAKLDTSGIAELVWQFMGDNPHELFECTGPAYMGFRSSYDLFGDGSLILVPLPGHTPGNTGLFINRTSGPRLFLIGDAAWSAENYMYPATTHPVLWSLFTNDDATARQTLIDLHRFYLRHPEIPVIGMHDARMQKAFMTVEERRLVEA